MSPRSGARNGAQNVPRTTPRRRAEFQETCGTAGTTYDYDVVMAHPASVRFESAVLDRLREFVSARPDQSSSSATNRLVDEGLRMEQHPMVLFRGGPTGRAPNGHGVGRLGDRGCGAVVTRVGAGPVGGGRLGARGGHRRLPVGVVRAAIDYWSDFPDEVDGEIAHAREADEPRRGDQTDDVNCLMCECHRASNRGSAEPREPFSSTHDRTHPRGKGPRTLRPCGAHSTVCGQSTSRTHSRAHTSASCSPTSAPTWCTSNRRAAACSARSRRGRSGGAASAASCST